MRRSKFVPIINDLLPSFPGFDRQGRMMIVAPVDHILRGICFEPSAFNNTSFHMEAFVMPLCVPSTYVYFTFASHIRRMDDRDDWATDLPGLIDEVTYTLRQKAIPFLDERATLTDFIDATADTSVHALRALAACQALVGRIPEAIEALDRLVATDIDQDIAWQRAIVENARSFRSRLISDPLAAQQQLLAAETVTTDALKLTRFRTGTYRPKRARLERGSPVH